MARAAAGALCAWLLRRKGLGDAIPAGNGPLTPSAPSPEDRLADALEEHLDGRWLRRRFRR